MQAKEIVRRISYTPWVGSVLGRLRLRRALQKLYFVASGKKGTLILDLAGVKGIFSTRTPVELRIVEAAWFGEREMLRAVQGILNPGDIFLDAGSNLGIFTIYAAKKVGPRGTVIAFEPESISHERLIRNIEINHLHNARVFKLALSDRRSICRLVLGDPEGVSQSSHLSDADVPSERVEATDYDSLVATEGFPIPNVVKMDIEGHEHSALLGMQKTLANRSCVALFCEIHPYALPRSTNSEGVLNLIKSLGFASLSITERGPQLHVLARKLRA